MGAKSATAGISRLLGGLLCVTATAQAKPSAAIPATAPTTSVSDLPSAQPQAAPAPAGHSTVQWDGAKLTITGGGDSLRNILRDISRQTGMKITGGVPGDPVYGTYGPASAQEVFTQLFDGMPVNMMLVNGTPTTPKELVLSARVGGATPSSPAQPLNDEPATQAFGEEFRRPPVTQAQPGQGQPSANPAPDSALPPLPVGLPQDGNGVAPAQNTNSSEQPQSPNGVKTPEQIFEELRARQKQQQPSK